MAGLAMIRIERLNYRVGRFALQDVSLEIQAGEYFVLLGPSGAGKTLLLESVCGLNRIDSGRIFVGGVDVTELEPRRRRIGYLPQDYALFPNKTVRDNVQFGVRRQLASRKDRARTVDDLLEMLGLLELAGRRPGKLSGGEKQRVALARALAVRPHVLLMDEPVSALDEQTRDGLCRQLKQLQRRTRTTAIHVCHNFTEMLAVADRAAVIYGGRIVQADAPRAILQRPRTAAVARFVQAENLFTARAAPDGDWLRLTVAGGIEFRAARPVSGGARGAALFMIRPENIRVAGEPLRNLPPAATTWRGAVSRLTDTGPLVQAAVACEGALEVLVSLGRKEFDSIAFEPGDPVHLAVSPQDVHVLED
jgi:ABC-type Fe3+/spermidine/putrescine transport system ATPase subunit